MSLSLSLRAKSSLLRSRISPSLFAIRNLRAVIKTIRHPELAEMLAQDRMLDQALTKVLRANMNCFDIGAHLGSFIVTAVKLCPSGHHVAFEPSPERAALLTERFPEVIVIPVALSDAEGPRDFGEVKGHEGYSGFAQKSPGAHVIKVQAKRLDDIDGLPRPDFIKVDVEGHEINVLSGAKKTILKTRPIILFESGSVYATPDREMVFSLLTSWDYSIFLPADIVHEKGKLGADEFRRCGIYPFRAFNFFAMPR